jgi:hypothetical protein
MDNQVKTMKPFFELSRNEILDLTNDELNDAIRLEAINRNIKPPITLSEALRRSEWRGYQKPGEAIKVFRLRQGWYTTDFGWLDESKAQAALEGLVKIEKVNYKDDNLKVSNADVTVETVWVGVSKSEQKAAAFEAFYEDTTEFDKVRDECIEKYSAVRQQAYNTKVRAERKTEYLRLAGGNEEIAKNFWGKAEGTSWPTDEEVSNG